jgi:phospholipid/cholesterol/gamma-HCH transport system substrate-binding protein
MNRSTIDLWVGIFVAIGFGAILFLALKVGNLLTLDRSPGYRLEASFENIGGLKLRAAVKAAGVVVGRVEQVRLDPKTYEAVVTMRMDNQYQFSRDTIASINTSGLLGEVYISFDAGGDPKMLADGDRVMKTQSAVVIEKLISQFLFEKASEGGKDTAPAGMVTPDPSAAAKAAQGAKK